MNFTTPREYLTGLGLEWHSASKDKILLEKQIVALFSSYLRRGSNVYSETVQKQMVNSEEFKNLVIKDLFFSLGCLRIVDKKKFYQTIGWEETNENFLPEGLIQKIEMHKDSDPQNTEAFYLYLPTDLVEQYIKNLPKKAKVLTDKETVEHTIKLMFNREEKIKEYKEILFDRFIELTAVVYHFDWATIIYDDFYKLLIQEYKRSLRERKIKI